MYYIIKYLRDINLQNLEGFLQDTAVEHQTKQYKM